MFLHSVVSRASLNDIKLLFLSLQMPKTEMLHVVKQQWITNIPNPFCCMAGGNCVGGTDHSSGRDLSTQSLVIHSQDATVFHQRFCFLRIAMKFFCFRAVSRYLNAGDQPRAHSFCWPNSLGCWRCKNEAQIRTSKQEDGDGIHQCWMCSHSSHLGIPFLLPAGDTDT